MKKIVIYNDRWCSGGVESMIINLLLNGDFSKFDIYLLVGVKETNIYDEMLNKLNIHFITILPTTYNPIVRDLKILKKLKNYIKEIKPDIVHINTCNTIGFKYSKIIKKHSKAKIIVHSHNTKIEKDKFKIKYLLHMLMKHYEKFIDYRLACSKAAGMFLFSKPFEVLKNGVDLDRFKKINNFMLYFNTYLPMILAMFVTLNNSAISSFSLEKDNIQVLCSMPLNMMEIILGKWIPSILIGSIFVIINGSLVWFYLEIPKWTIIYSYVIPFIALLFVSLTSIVLDYRFIEKNETDDNVIIKGRIISFIPTFLAIIIGIGPFFLPLYGEYELLLGGYALGMLFLLIFLLLYLIVRHKKLKMNLIN